MPIEVQSILSHFHQTAPYWQLLVRKTGIILCDSNDCVSSADDGCIMIWARKDGSLVQTIEEYFHGQVSCLVWIKLPENENLGFIVGYADGVLQVFRRTSADVCDDPLTSANSQN